MSKYRVAPSAVADLDEIWLYIARNASVEAAERFVEFLTSRFPLLAANPGMGRSRPNLGEACEASRSTTTASAIAGTREVMFGFFT